VGSAVGVFLVPMSLEHIGIGGTMTIAAALLIFAGLVSVRWAPETTQLNLDEASGLNPGAQQATAPAPTLDAGRR
jgi:putative MFS transporter